MSDGQLTVVCRMCGTDHSVGPRELPDGRAVALCSSCWSLWGESDG